MSRLSGKVALVTGGARGLGAATVRAFVEQGAKVVFGDVLVDEGEALDVRSGHETARMLKTASPTLSRKSDNDFHGALRAFRTMLGFELAKLGF